VLHTLDGVVIGAYLLLALGIGVASRVRGEEGRESFFLADRALPWWWAGTSIAATTFAADTPLAITGIVASRGFSGNWVWLSWLGVHAAVVVLFARRWWRTGVVTDAEFLSLRYAGRSAEWLRSMRALLYGLVYNVIILGWVLRAMGKIVQPLVDWPSWAPWMVTAASRVLPAQSALGGPDEAITVILLVAVVALYSTVGGLRGVVRTDLVQFALGLLGSIWLAVVAWSHAGGRSGIRAGLEAAYAERAAAWWQFLPSVESGWGGAIGFGAFGLGAYLLVQSYANVPADGGGYLQQRLSSARSEDDAEKAALLFVVLQYGVRLWPWLMVALAALVIAPVGNEGVALGPQLGAVVASDREMAYPALLLTLLPPGVLGLLIVSLLAAFMSTVDTHFNWGASYVVSDVALRMRPDLSPRSQIRIARVALVTFSVAAVLVAFQIERIEQAWRWVAVLGAALGVPTVVRWLWWRVTAAAELAGAVVGLLMAAGLIMTDALLYEQQLVVISVASAVAMLVAIAVGPRPDLTVIARFMYTVQPFGWWPALDTVPRAAPLWPAVCRLVLLVAMVLIVLRTGVWLLIG
jgi:solute:Na+ symporter, SSS family